MPLENQSTMRNGRSLIPGDFYIGEKLRKELIFLSFQDLKEVPFILEAGVTELLAVIMQEILR